MLKINAALVGDLWGAFCRAPPLPTLAAENLYKHYMTRVRTFIAIWNKDSHKFSIIIVHVTLRKCVASRDVGDKVSDASRAISWQMRVG